MANIFDGYVPGAEPTERQAYDGDTFTDKETGTRVRLKGADAPERRPAQAGAELSANIFQGYLDGKDTKVETTGEQTYDRQVGRVTNDNGDVATQMIKQGVARPTIFSSQEQLDAEGVSFTRNFLKGSAADVLTSPEQAQIDATMQREKAENPYQFDLSKQRGFGFTPNGAFKDALQRGTDTAQGSMYAAANALGSFTGMDAMTVWGEEGMFQNMVEAAQNPARVESYENIDGLAALGTYVAEALGENAMNMVFMATGAGTSATLARAMLGKALVRKASLFGAGVPSYGMAVGEVQQELKEGGIDSPGTALIAGIPIAGMDVAGLDIAVGQVFREVAVDTAKSLLGQALKGFGVGAAKGAVAEMPTEALQELMTMTARAMHDPSYDLFSEENQKRLIDAGLKGGLVGSAMGASSRAARTTFDFLRTVEQETRDDNSRQGSTSDEGGDPTGTSAPAGTPPFTPPPLGGEFRGGTVEAVSTAEVGGQRQHRVRTTAGEHVVDATGNDVPFGPAPRPAPSPESLRTIDAQADAVRDPTSEKDSLLVTSYSPEPTSTEGLGERIETPIGVVFTKDEAKAQAVKDAVKRYKDMTASAPFEGYRGNVHPDFTSLDLERLIGEVLFGITGGKPPGGDRVVVAANKDGTPVAEIVANAETEAAAAEAAARQAPEGGSVNTRNPREVLQQREELRAQEKPVNVWHGTKENAELSNLASRPFTDKKGRKYVSVEHAYQSWKSGKFDEETYNKYREGGRKIVGRKGTRIRDNWNVALMESLVRESFKQNPQAAQQLLATGEAPITHNQDRGVWREQFPRILMKVRSELAQQPQQEDLRKDEWSQPVDFGGSARKYDTLSKVARRIREGLHQLRGPNGETIPTVEGQHVTNQVNSAVMNAFRTHGLKGKRGSVNEDPSGDDYNNAIRSEQSREMYGMWSPDMPDGGDSINKKNKADFEKKYTPSSAMTDLGQKILERRHNIIMGFKAARVLANEFTELLGLDTIVVHIMDGERSKGTHGIASIAANHIGISDKNLAALGAALGPNASPSLRQRTAAAAALETLYHELGHMLQTRLLSLASEEDINAVFADYYKWADTRKGKGTVEAELSRKGLAGKVRVLMSAMGLKDPALVYQDPDYAVNFSEWWADNVSKYMTARLANKEIKGLPKLLEQFAEIMYVTYAKLREALGVKGLPAPGVKKFLDRHIQYLEKNDPIWRSVTDEVLAKGDYFGDKSIEHMDRSPENAMTQAFRKATGVDEEVDTTSDTEEDASPESHDTEAETETVEFKVTTAAARLTIERLYPNAKVEGPKGGPWTVTEELPPAQVRGEDTDARDVRQALAKALDDGRNDKRKRLEFVDDSRTLKNGKHPKVRVNAQGLITLGLLVDGKPTTGESEVERLRRGLLSGLAYLYTKGFRPATEKLSRKGRASMPTFKGNGIVEPHQLRAMMSNAKKLNNKIGIPLDFVVYTTGSKRDLTVNDLLNSLAVKQKLVEQTEMLRNFIEKHEREGIPVPPELEEKLRYNEETLSELFDIKPEPKEPFKDVAAIKRNRKGEKIGEVVRKPEQEGTGTRQTYDPTRAGKVMRRTQAIQDRIENPGVERKRVDQIPDAPKVDEADEEQQIQSFRGMESDETQASLSNTNDNNESEKDNQRIRRGLPGRREGAFVGNRYKASKANKVLHPKSGSNIGLMAKSLGEKGAKLVGDLLEHIGLRNKVWIADEAGVSLLIEELKIKRAQLREEYKREKDADKKEAIIARGAEINLQIERYEQILRDSPDARIIYNDDLKDARDRIPLIFVSMNVTGKRAKVVKLAHELGHLIQRVALDTAPKEVQDALREALGTENFAENFANQLIKWVDRRAPARTIVEKFFKGLREHLHDMWYYLRTAGGVYRLDGTFADFMDGLVAVRTQRQRGRPENVHPSHGAYQHAPATVLGRRFLKHLENFTTGPYMPYRTDGEASSDFTIPQSVRTATQQAMSTRRGQTLLAAGKSAGEILNTVRNFTIRSNDAYLRAINSPTATWIADQWHKRAGDLKRAVPIPEEVRMFKASFHERLNAVVDMLPKVKKLKFFDEVDTGSAEYQELLRLLRDQTTEREFSQRGDRVGQAGVAIRQFFDALRDKMVHEYDIKLKNRPGYFPLVVDMNKWMHDKQGVINTLLANGVTLAKAEEFYEYIVKVNGMPLDALSVDDETLAPGFRFKRRHEYLNYLRQDYMIDDLHTTMAFYLHAAARRSVIENRFRLDPVHAAANTGVIKRFGISVKNPMAGLQLKLAKALENGEITAEQYRHIKTTILEGNLGRLGGSTHPLLKRFSAAIVLYENIRLLGFAVLTSLVDPGQTLWRSDMNFTSNINALRGVFDRATREQMFRMARLIGTIQDDVTDHILNDQMSSQFLGPNVRKWNERFFKGILMHQWTNITRVMAMSVGKDYILDHAAKARQGNAESARRLAELGIDESQVAAWVTDNQALEGHDAVYSAINTFVDEAIIRPEAAVRPWWGSDPRFMLVFHLKSFMWGYHEQILRRLWAETKNKQGLMKAIPVLGLVLATMPLAMAGYEARRFLSWFPRGAPAHTEKHGWDYFQELGERSGYLGIMQLLVDADQAEEFGKFSVLSVLGPAADQVGEFLSKDFDYFMLRATPLLAQSGAARAWIREQ